MGRGQRCERAVAGSSLLFGPRRSRPLSEEARDRRNQDLKDQLDQKLDLMREWSYYANAVGAIVAREPVTDSSFGYGAAGLLASLRADADRLNEIAHNIDDELVELADIERSDLLNCGDILREAVARTPSPQQMRRFRSRKWSAARQVNEALNQVTAILAPVEERLRAVVGNEVDHRQQQAYQDYYKTLIGGSNYRQFVANINNSEQLLSNYQQIENIFQQGQCLEDLADDLKKIDQDHFAGDISLALMHIAVKDRPREYVERVQSQLTVLRNDLGLAETEPADEQS